MYLCYLDESGTPDPGSNTDHFILIGLAIPAETWKEKDRQVNVIKQKYGLGTAEIHTAWMARDYPEQRRVPDFDKLGWTDRRKAVIGARALNLARPRTKKQQNSLTKNYKKTEAYVHLSRDERKACLRELARLVGSWRDARSFADAHHKRHVDCSRCFDIAFEQVVTRFNTFLSIVGGPHGLLVQDNNKTVAERLTDAMRRYHAQGTIWSQVDKIVETPLFVDSQLTSMVQLTDLCAYATRRFFEKNERDLFYHVYKRFDRNRQRLVGLRHFTGGHQCKCRVCKAHGRYS